MRKPTNVMRLGLGQACVREGLWVDVVDEQLGELAGDVLVDQRVVAALVLVDRELLPAFGAHDAFAVARLDHE